MTKSEIQTALNSVPANLIDAGPEELKKYLESTYPNITIDEVDTLTAAHIINHLGDLGHLKTAPSPWQTIKAMIQSKYQELSPGHRLYITLEIVAVAAMRNKLVIVFN